MKMLRSNFETALTMALRERQAYEQWAYGADFESAFVAGLRAVLEAINRGERITIEDK
jgi:hypothetical protein